MDIIDELFSDANAVSTHQVARAFDISESDARFLADELGVAKIGAAYAWTRDDATALSSKLDELDAENDDQEGDEDESEDEDESADDDDDDGEDDEAEGDDA
jgi:hypothetical protein